MKDKKIQAIKLIGASLIAFQQRNTPAGTEYARRLRIALLHTLRGDYARAERWIDLVDVQG